MKKLLRIALLLNFICCISFNAIGQKKKQIKWGKVPIEQVNYSECEYDKDAAAVKLHDVGHISMIGGGEVNYFRHVRVKILKKEGTEHANLTIPYYNHDRTETIRNIKAQTINFSEDGTMKITKVDKKDIFKVKVNEDWNEIRITFPDAVVGSIIEWNYSLDSKNLTFLKSWYFQDDIPTLYSEYSSKLSENIDYRVINQGHRSKFKFGNRPLNKWVMENLPAIRDEAFCPNVYDFCEKLTFQVSGYNTSRGYVELLSSWENLAEELLNQVPFVRYRGRKIILKKVIQDNQLAASTDPMERVKAAYNFVNQRLNWNGDHEIYTEQPMNTLLESKSGNSAELNLLLVELLRKLDLDAAPVLASTKSHGLISREYPLLTQFNHLIATVVIDGKDIVLDATDKMRSYNLLAVDDLNFAGFRISKKKQECRWVDLTPSIKTKMVVLSDIDFTNPAQPVYKITYTGTGYSALRLRKKINPTEPELVIAENFNTEENSYEIEDIEARNLRENTSKAFALKFNLKTEEALDEQPKNIYINPILIKTFDKNPFLDEERELPIDLYYPMLEKFITKFKVPEGYEVDELPQAVQVLLNENGDMDFRYQVVQKDRDISIVCSFKIERSFYLREEYSSLRELVKQVFTKQGEYIVLKKTE